LRGIIHRDVKPQNVLLHRETGRDRTRAARLFERAARDTTRRGTLAAQLGDTLSAMRDYDELLRLWSDPDPALRKQRDLVARQRAELDQGRDTR
jgi:serine/threonine protein kinase